ncbi:hypothetical protein CYY_000340 [Polysphondylium violaceum]|uniref:Large ribosomal subunit protein bL28m n=1 Tax=Polysphondylium violaceum TaxID=133409 RepID=A0A8J4QB42_9MYCE|nr:hypothetical protein CYY_000340 [Polysphondylium violaceum]
MSLSMFSSIAELTCRGVMKRAQRGLFGGKEILFGNNVSFSNKRTRRHWKPNVQMKTYHSDILETNLRVKVTCHTMRCIDKAGSFDNYILKTKEKNLDSELGSDLKVAMKKVMKEKAFTILAQEEATTVATTAATTQSTTVESN